MSGEKDTTDLTDKLNKFEKEALNWHLNKLYQDIQDKYEGDLSVLSVRVESLERFFLSSEKKVKETVAYWEEQLGRMGDKVDENIKKYREAESMLRVTLAEIDPRYLKKIKEVVKVLEEIGRWRY